MKKGRHALSAQKDLFVIADTARPEIGPILAASIRNMGRAMKETASVPNKALAHEGATRIPPKDSGEPDFSKGAAGNDRKNWLFWLAA
jgi:hypothetical protein